MPVKWTRLVNSDVIAIGHTLFIEIAEACELKTLIISPVCSLCS